MATTTNATRPPLTNPALVEIQGLFDKVVGSKSTMTDEDTRRLEAELTGLEAKNDPELAPFLAAIRKASQDFQAADAELKREKDKLEPQQVEALQTQLDQLNAALLALDTATVASTPKKEDVAAAIIKDMTEIQRQENQIAAQKKLFSDPSDAGSSLQELQQKYVGDVSKAPILANQAFKDAKRSEDALAANRAAHDVTRANFQAIVTALRGLKVSSKGFAEEKDAKPSQQLSALLAEAQLENVVAFDDVKPLGDLSPAEAADSLKKGREWRAAAKIDAAPARLTDLTNYHNFVKGGAGAQVKKLEAAAEAQQRAFENLAAKTTEKKLTGVDQISRFAAMTADVARAALEAAISRYQVEQREVMGRLLKESDRTNGFLEVAETERLKAQAEAKLLADFLSTLNGAHSTAKPEEIAAVMEQYGRDQAAKVLGMSPGSAVDAGDRAAVNEIVANTKGAIVGNNVNGHFGVSRVALLNLRTSAKTQEKEGLHRDAKTVSEAALDASKGGLDGLGRDLTEFLEEVCYRFQQMNIEVPSAFDLEASKQLLQQRIVKLADDIARTGESKVPKEYGNPDKAQLILDLDAINTALDAFSKLLERTVEELEQKAAEVHPTGTYAAEREKELLAGIIREKRKFEDGKRHKDNISGAIHLYKALLVGLVDMIATFKPTLDAAKREFQAQTADTFHNRRIAKTATIEVTGPQVVSVENGGTERPFGTAEAGALRAELDLAKVHAIVNSLHVKK